MLNQNNELLKLSHEIYNKNNKNNVTHYQEKSIKACPKRDDFQMASKTATTKIRQLLEKDTDNSKNNNRFISPNRFGRLFYEDINNDENESVTNNIDSTKTLQNDQINGCFGYPTPGPWLSYLRLSTPAPGPHKSFN